MSRFHEVLLSKDGSNLFVASGDSIKLYSLTDHKTISTFTYTKPASDSNQTPAPTHLHGLTLSRDGAHLVAVNNESKAVHVFDSGTLTQVSQRPFPKRPSAVDTTPDSKTLIVGDKFGDVYAVPLASEESILKVEAKGETEASIDPILGHVSMLVDVAVAEKDGKLVVITADRDEHIRVTRYPESYIIDRWLFGHEEFVSSLCVLGSGDLLVSGGGDDFLLLWNWSEGKQLDRFDLNVVKPYLTAQFHAPQKTKHSKPDTDGEPTELEITVVQIVAVPSLNQILVLVEATAAVLQLAVTSTGISHVSTIELPARAISVTASGTKAVVSLDQDVDPIVEIAVTETGHSITGPVPNIVAESTSTANLYPTRQLRKRGEH